MNSESSHHIHIILNGESAAVHAGQTLVDLIETRKPRPPFAVEINKRLVRRAEYDRVALREGDAVEIVTLVGGG
jgi:thiamine biosynthesis protein ThiS